MASNSLIIESSIGNFKLLPAGASNYRPKRSEVIHLLSSFYDSIHYPYSGLNKKHYENGLCDGFLKKAEDVALSSYFSDFPGSRARLMPLADSYINQWKKVLSEPGVDLMTRVEGFVHAHVNFSQQYIKEVKVCDPTSSLAVELNFPDTLKYFYSCVGLYLAAHPDQISLFRERLGCVDQDILPCVSSMVILHLLKLPNRPDLELLKSFEIGELASSYQSLSDVEKLTLEKWILDSSVELSGKLKELQDKFMEIYWRLNEKSLALDFTSCFRELANELNEDFEIADVLKLELLKIDPKIIEPNLSGVLSGLLHLSRPSLERLYSFLPTLKEIEGVTEKDSDKITAIRCDLRNERKLYRLFGIFQLIFNK